MRHSTHTAGRKHSIFLLVWHQLSTSPWGSHVTSPCLSFSSCKIWIKMFFEVYPDPLIKDKDFKTLFFTANSSEHELHLWHGKSSSTLQVLALLQRENRTLHHLIIIGTGKIHFGCWYTPGFWQVCVLFLNTVANCFEFKELFSTAQGYLGGKPTSGCITPCPWEYCCGLMWSWVDCEDTQLDFWTSSSTAYVLINVFYVPGRFLVFLFRRMHLCHDCLHWLSAIIFLFFSFPLKIIQYLFQSSDGWWSMHSSSTEQGGSFLCHCCQLRTKTAMNRKK